MQEAQAEGISSKQKALIASIVALAGAAGLAHYLLGGMVAFLFALFALAGVAWLVGFATEQLGEHFGPAATGVMQSTLGNLPEFFVVFFALKAGQTEVAQTSIIGSILANGLLVLGLVFVAGARRSADGKMRFHKRLPNDTATLLLMSVTVIALVGTSVATQDNAADHADAVSTIAAIILLAIYTVWVVGYIRSDAAGEPSRGAPKLSLKLCVLLLAVAGVMAALVSEWFISGLEPAMQALNISEAFAGLVIVAIAGNAAENFTGIMLAWKGQYDLAVSVVKNSVAQIAAFLFPALVLVSLLLPSTLTFAIAPVLIVALVLAALSIWQISGDGEATMFEGAALIGSFVILAGLMLFE